MAQAIFNNVVNGDQEVFYVDPSGALRHHYWNKAENAWVDDGVKAEGWDPGKPLDDKTNSNGVMQVWGELQAGGPVQCYWSGQQWVTQPL